MSNEEYSVLIKQGRSELLPEFWEQIEGFIRYLANRIIHKLPASAGVEFDDLVQSGYFAVLEAVERFDAERGVAFTTILGVTLKTAFAEAAGYRTIRQRNDPLYRPSTTSLDAPLSAEDTDGATLLDIVPDERDAIASTEEQMFFEQLHNALDEILSNLPQEQSDILKQRFYENKSLNQISADDGRPIERIRQIESKAFQNIRKPKNLRILDSYRLEVMTPYFLKVGLQRFQTTHASAVEEIVFIRERIRQSMV